MERKPSRSTAFRSGRRLSKLEQEHLIGELSAKGYEQTTGIKLEGNMAGGNPPDRLFSYENFRIGVEIFELGQFYEARALLSDLTGRVYSEFESRGASRRYEGIRIDLGILQDIKTAEALRTRWRQNGISRRQKTHICRAIRELAPRRCAVTRCGPERRSSYPGGSWVVSSRISPHGKDYYP